MRRGDLLWMAKIEIEYAVMSLVKNSALKREDVRAFLLYDLAWVCFR